MWTDIAIGIITGVIGLWLIIVIMTLFCKIIGD